MLSLYGKEILDGPIQTEGGEAFQRNLDFTEFLKF